MHQNASNGLFMVQNFLRPTDEQVKSTVINLTVAKAPTLTCAGVLVVNHTS